MEAVEHQGTMEVAAQAAGLSYDFDISWEYHQPVCTVDIAARTVTGHVRTGQSEQWVTLC